MFESYTFHIDYELLYKVVFFLRSPGKRVNLVFFVLFSLSQAAPKTTLLLRPTPQQRRLHRRRDDGTWDSTDVNP